VAGALRELVAARALTRELQRIAGIGTFVFDIATGTARWSGELRRIVGIESGEADPGLDRFLSLLHPDDRERVVSHFEQKTELGQRAHSVHRIITPSGECRHVDVHGEVVKLSEHDGLTLVGTVQDITERRKAEEELSNKSAQVRRMEAELAFLTRQRAMGTMAATLAHELNQPLTAISNYSSGLLRLAAVEADVADISWKVFARYRRAPFAPARSSAGCEELGKRDKFGGSA
jgi:PAS domain S-box-containing protein